MSRQGSSKSGLVPQLEPLEPRLLLSSTLPAFQPVTPYGSLIYRSQVTDQISTPGEVDGFTMHVCSDQVIMRPFLRKIG
jgi:hypothetical protein